MKKYFALIALLFTTLCHAEYEVTQANSEAECSSIVEGVNTITGSYSFTVPIHHVPGAQPVTYYKNFNSHDYLCEGEPFWSQSYRGYLEVGQKKINGVKHNHAFYIEDGGFSIFLVEPNKEKDICLKLSHAYSLTRGVTNTARGLPSAATNLNNMTLCLAEGRRDQYAVLTKPDGTIQNFSKFYKRENQRSYAMQDQIFPNGNRSECHYDNNFHRIGTTFTNADKSVVFLKENLEHSYDDKKNSISYMNRIFSDGHKIDQAYKGYRAEYTERKDLIYYLYWTTAVGAPKENYAYEDVYDSNYSRLYRRSKPDQRYVELRYYDWYGWDEKNYIKEKDPRRGRVREIKVPAGNTTHPITTYSFEYNITKDKRDSKILREGDTLVTDGNGNCKKYIYDCYHRLAAINHMGKNTQSEPYRQDIFIWGPTGFLLNRRFNDHTGLCINYKRFEYDERGNVVKQETYGCFSKELKTFPLTKGRPTDPNLECQTIINTYADNRFNHLLSTDNGEMLTTFTYLEETNLPVSKIVTDRRSISIREFYTYDRNKALIEQICDNGTGTDKEDLTNVTQRTIKKIVPRTEGTGIGLPIDEYVYGFDVETQTEKLITRVHNTYNFHYKMSRQDVYDSNNQFAHCKQWVYDEKGNLTQEIDALGNVSTYAYDANYNCIHQLSNSGQKEFFYTYDFMNRLIKKELKDPQGNSYTTSYRYDVMGNLLAEIDLRGNETQFVYDAHNRCIEVKRPSVNGEQVTLHKEYDECDNIVCVTDSEGGITRSQFNSFGKPVKITYADGAQEFMCYDFYNRIIEKTERNGTKKTYQYDALGRILEERILDTDGSVLSVQTNCYDAFNLLSSTDVMGLTTVYTYDHAGRIVKEQTAEKILTKSYDTLGRLETETLHNDDQAQVSRFVYDFKNQLLETIIEDLLGQSLSRESVDYDQEGRQTLVHRYDAQGSHSTLIEYDALDRPVLVKLANGSSFHALYDDQANQKRLFTPDGQETLTLFDALGRVATIEKRNKQGVLIDHKQCAYDLNDRLLKEMFTVYSA